jgi:hypothetical protein
MKRVIKLAAALSLALLMAGFVLRWSAPSWSESAFVLPGDSARIVLLRRRPLYRREYERKIRVEVPERAPFTFPLAPDGGGHHGIDVYRQAARLADGTEAPVLRFRDHSGIYRVDLLHLRLLETGAAARFSTGTYLGRIDANGGRPRFRPAGERSGGGHRCVRCCSNRNTPFLLAVMMSGRPSPFTSTIWNWVPTPES